MGRRRHQRREYHEEPGEALAQAGARGLSLSRCSQSRSSRPLQERAGRLAEHGGGSGDPAQDRAPLHRADDRGLAQSRRAGTGSARGCRPRRSSSYSFGDDSVTDLDGKGVSAWESHERLSRSVSQVRRWRRCCIWNIIAHEASLRWETSIYGTAKWLAHRRRLVPAGPRTVPLFRDQTRKSPRAHVVYAAKTSRTQRHRT